ncbi:MAG: glycosyltransferase family 2 protein [Planctomycetes bacterium]|nr:glycosyltransferase family 2 protein [Planctomycetota bacterium]
MRVSLFLPTLDGMPLLERALDAIDRQRHDFELERLAIDSGSRDGTVACLERHGFRVERIDRREFDHGSTRDRGLARATGELVVLMTQDAVPADERWLAHLAAAFDDPSVVAAYSRQVPRDDCNPLVADRLRAWAAGRAASAVQQLAPANSLDELPPAERLARCAYDNVSGCVRRSTWERFRFGPCSSGEDVVFGKRVIEAGHRIAFCADSVVIHSHDRTPRDEGRRTYADHIVLAEHFGIRVLPTLRACVRSIGDTRRVHSERLAALGLPPAERRRLERWARGFAFWTEVGTYLGGNAARLRSGLGGWTLGLVDRWMRR